MYCIKEFLLFLVCLVFLSTEMYHTDGKCMNNCIYGFMYIYILLCICVISYKFQTLFCSTNKSWRTVFCIHFNSCLVVTDVWKTLWTATGGRRTLQLWVYYRIKLQYFCENKLYDYYYRNLVLGKILIKFLIIASIFMFIVKLVIWLLLIFQYDDPNATISSILDEIRQFVSYHAL